MQLEWNTAFDDNNKNVRKPCLIESFSTIQYIYAVKDIKITNAGFVLNLLIRYLEYKCFKNVKYVCNSRGIYSSSGNTKVNKELVKPFLTNESKLTD